MKKYRVILFSIILLITCIANVLSYSLSDNNNPGENVSSSSGNGAGEGTNWKGQIKAVRIRVFRGETQISDDYFYLTTSASKCSKVSSITANICETPKYDYSTVASTSGVTCREATQNLGCIAASNLNETWGIESYNGSYLDEYLKDGNTYNNLKNILSGMGYNASNSNNDDVVIVEPATYVLCASNGYFGTSTALMKKNISYRGKNNNVCSANDNVYNGKTGYTFQNVFRSMSTALKVSESEKWQGNSEYSGFGYFKYNVSQMNYVKENGDLNVEIYVDGTNPRTKITSQSLTYNIRAGHSCNGDIVLENVSTQNKGYNISNLKTGDYSIEMKIHPSEDNYQKKAGINYTCRDVTLTSTGSTVLVPYTTGCYTALNEKKQDGYTMNEAIELYNLFGHNELLSLSNPSCANKTCNSKNNSIGCFSANIKSNVSNDDLTCAEVVRNANDEALAFCETKFNLNNNLILNSAPMTTFYGKSGQFLIKKIRVGNVEKYVVNDSNYNTKYLDAQNGVASATLEKKCYVLKGSNLPSTYNGDMSNIVGDIYLNNNIILDKKEIDGNSEPVIDTTNDIFDIYTFQKRYNFDLYPVYLENLSGKIVSSSSSYSTSILGLVSEFTALNGSLQFGVSYDGEDYTASEEDSCQYVLKQEIITGGDLQLEFRSIDTNKPFNRNTMSNWSDGNDNTKDNNTVKKYIKDAVNSYGMDKDGKKASPKYKITLTPNDVREIRNYNKEIPYDNYLMEEVNYNENKVIRNSFLYSLEQGKLNNKNLNGKLHNLKYPI